MSEQPVDSPRPDSEIEPTTPAPEQDPLRRSRTSYTWAALVLLGRVSVLLIVFIAQNTQRVEVSFFGWDVHPPLSVALLIAATAGLLLAGVAGSLRIVQLRRRVRRPRAR